MDRCNLTSEDGNSVQCGGIVMRRKRAKVADTRVISYGKFGPSDIAERPVIYNMVNNNISKIGKISR